MKEYKILAENEEYDKLYGEFNIEITEKDIENLLISKILYIPVNDEYAVNVKIKKETEGDKKIKFLNQYEKLCQKYEMGLVGCGCCGSPELVDKKGFTIYDDVNYENNQVNIGYKHWKEVIKNKNE